MCLYVRKYSSANSYYCCCHGYTCACCGLNNVLEQEFIGGQSKVSFCFCFGHVVASHCERAQHMEKEWVLPTGNLLFLFTYLRRHVGAQHGKIAQIQYVI